MNSGVIDGLDHTKQTLEEIIKTLQPSEEYGLVDIPAPCRYHALNLLNLFPDGIGTIEIRLKHGSHSANELCAYIDLFMLFFESVVSRWRSKGAIIDETVLQNAETFDKRRTKNEKDAEQHVSYLCSYFFDGFSDCVLGNNFDLEKRFALKNYFEAVLSAHPIDAPTYDMYADMAVPDSTPVHMPTYPYVRRDKPFDTTTFIDNIRGNTEGRELTTQLSQSTRDSTLAQSAPWLSHRPGLHD
jgi:hypothetical protein